MNRYRSHLLRSIPATTNPNAWLHVSARLVILGGAGFSLLLCWLIYAFQPLAKQGVAYTLYAVHDYVLLPLKGYLWTLFFPFGLIVWGSLATMGLLMVASLLSDGALLRATHLGLARAVVRRRWTHQFIQLAAQLFSFASLRPGFMQRVAEAEQVLAEQGLLAGKRSAADLIALTRLRIELATIAAPRRSTAETNLLALAWWSLTDSWLMLRALPEQTNASYWRDHVDLVKQLADQVPSAGAIVTAFHPATLASELGALVDLQRRGVPPYAPSSIKLGLQLAQAAEGRARQLDAIRDWIEKRMSERVDDVDEVRDAAGLRDCALDLPMAWLPFAGVLNLAVALRLSWWLGMPQVALACMESLETLALALDLVQLNINSNSEVGSILAGYQGLVESLPEPQHYQLCSHLAERQRQAQLAEWEKLPGGSAALLPPSDLDLARTRVQALAWAAGLGLILPQPHD